MQFLSLFVLALIGFPQSNLVTANAEIEAPFALIDSNFIDPEDEIAQNNSTSTSMERMIFPGTKWCGEGDRAENDNDLGYLEEVDKCCYAHDHCDSSSIPSGESRHGLTNNTPYSKLHCSCDTEFYNCLKRDGGASADAIGNIYSHGMKQCYKKAYPIVRCNRYEHELFSRRCVDYIVDSSRPKRYQFFDLPFY